MAIIIGINQGHDGTICGLEDGELVFSVEAEKNNHPRFSPLAGGRLEELSFLIPEEVDVLAYSGWEDYSSPEKDSYCGLERREMLSQVEEPYRIITPHERAHILSSYALSPFPQGEPCYVLLWEGTLGRFYHIDAELTITCLADILQSPGHRYSFLYELADPLHADDAQGYSYSVAGKLMALTAFSDHGDLDPEEDVFVQRMFQDQWTLRKADFKHLKIYNSGVQHPDFTRVAHRFSQALFDFFHAKVEKLVSHKLNLLVAGGCGLNCDWNVQWKTCGLFNDIFIPPVVNDSGVAIGAAVDGQLMLTGSAKLLWSVYAGLPLYRDCNNIAGFRSFPLDINRLADLLKAGEIVAWSQGRYEMGPRALGHRSLLASPFSSNETNRLNQIKDREPYRPVAPICIEREAGKWFSGPLPSPYMLGFSFVLDPHLKAITHVDNTARVQTINPAADQTVHALLSAFQEKAGHGVLCNTSLNNKGKGFLNTISDVGEFCAKGGIRAIVADETMFLRSDLQLME